jgi:hypothetical protein
MAAIITPRFRKNNAAAFKADLTTAPSDYYIGLGRPDAWPNDAAPPTPTGSPLELIQAKTGLIQLKEIRTSIDGAGGDSSISRMIPRVDWVSGRTFKAYAMNDITRLYSSISGSITTYPCYCINENRLYLCKTAGGGVVGNAPVHTTGDNSAVADGYVWTHLRLLTSPATVLNLQNFVAIPDSDSQTLELLPSWYVGIGVNINSTDLLINSRYRQVSVVKWNNGFTGSSKVNLINTPYFNMGTAFSPVIGSIITQTVAEYTNRGSVQPNPQGIVAAVDGIKVYFTQVPSATGTVTAFSGSGSISINGEALRSYGSIGTTLTDVGVLTKVSNIPQGDVVFLENRQPVTHISNQIEEVRTVIQF